MSIEKLLAERLAQIGAAPFLFIGSGLSRRYLNIEAWEGLLRRFAVSLPNPFEYYFGLANRDLPRTAALIAEAFYEVWWKHDDYQDSRAAFGSEMRTNASCMKFEIAKYLATYHYVPGTNPAIDAEVDLLKKATLDGIITTNWDTFLENIFPDFQVYIGQNELLFCVSQGVAEIYKIHGCATEANSLVLTTADYESFNNRNPYLAAKLLTIFVEHPVIFLGYSLSDENITSILRQIASCLTNENIAKLTDRLIFVQYDWDRKGDSFESSVTQVDGHTIPITVVRTSDFTQVYRPLTILRRRFSARLLRKMKEHVYELVKSSDPKSKLGVVDIDAADSFADLEVVFGVGVTAKVGTLGYSPISRIDLLKDVMEEKSQYEPRLIVRDTLPNVTQNTPFVPTFRYLREAGLIGADGTINTIGLHDRVKKTAGFRQSNFYPPKNYQREQAKVHALGSIEEIVEAYKDNACLFISLLKPEQLDAELLRRYIITNLKFITAKKSHTQTYFRRLICFYDWLAFH